MHRYHYEDFCWFPCASVPKALDCLKLKADAIHLNGSINSVAELRTLLDAVTAERSVEALFLPCNNLGDEGCKEIAEFLKRDFKVSFLYLERNNIGDDGINSLVEGLSQNKRLRTIMLGDNAVTNVGVEIFTSFLRSEASHIKEFSLGSLFTDEGAFMIAKALNFNKSIEAIYLNNNQMGKAGAEVLAEVVSRHNTCVNFQVSSDKVSASDFSDKLKGMTNEELKKAFETAVRNDEKGPWMRSKIMVVGQGRAGKSATVRSLLGQEFVQDLDSTIGASISQSNTKAGGNGSSWQDKKGSKVDFTVDTASRLAALKLARMRNQDAEQLENYDLQSTIQYYKDKLQREEEEVELSKQNQEFKVFTDDEINKKFEAELVTNKQSGRDDIAFTIWDYGGQTVFYTLHHLFLTRYGIYMLVFDMREIVCADKDPLEKAAIRSRTRDYIIFWLNSILMHAPDAPLLLIGTFLDAVESASNLELVDAFVKRILGKKYPQVVGNGALSFFPLNNKSPQRDVTVVMSEVGAAVGRNIEVIRDKIEVVARNADFVNQSLSLRWVKTLDTLLEREDSFLPIEEVYKVAADCGIETTADCDEMLAYFHELGMIVHLTSTQHLKNVVTTKPQWLIDALSKVIRDSELHAYNAAEVAKAGLTEQYDLMKKEAIATTDWLEYLWPKTQVKFLVDLMRRTLLLSDWRFGEFSKDPAYLVPSLLKDYSEEEEELANIMLLQFKDDQDEMAGLLSDEEREQLQQQQLKEKLGNVAAQVMGGRTGFGRFNLMKLVPTVGKKERIEVKLTENEKMGVYLGELEPNFLELQALYAAYEADLEQRKEKKEKKDVEQSNRRIERMDRVMITDEQAAQLEGIYNQRHPFQYGFVSKKPICRLVFDFSKSFLPNGVFQRLLCLCILKAISSKEEDLKPPFLMTNVAKIFMEDDQCFTLTKRGLQILCQVEKDHQSSYRVLLSMMEKLKVDVMGTNLSWDIYLETEVNSREFRNRKVLKKGQSIRTFRHVDEVKAEKRVPWFADENHTEEDNAKIVGLELEEFIEEINDF